MNDYKSIESLDSDHGLPGKLSFYEKCDGFPIAVLESRDGRCEVSLYGGQVLTCRLGESPLLWLSSDAVYETGKAIRGGVPLIFPWFGGHSTDNSLPSHGFMRLSRWSVSEVTDVGNRLAIELVLQDSVESRKMWPHSFLAKLRISLDKTGLETRLKLTNSGTKAWSWAGGFHPYFGVDGVNNVNLPSLQGVEYLDLLDNQKKRQDSSLRFGTEIDRVYFTHPKSISLSQKIIIESHGTDRLVVWNPGPDSNKADIHQGGQNEFVCVEPMRAAGSPTGSSVAPGETTELTLRIHSIESSQAR